MKKIGFNEDWFCRQLGDAGREVAVTLPHDAMITEKRSAKSRGMHNIGWFEAKDYVYTKHFFIPREDEGKEFYFEIEGAYRNAEVCLNGVKAANRPYGYSDFFVCATPYIKAGEENEIEIYTYNSEQPNSRWYTGTGLFRPVSLFVAEKEHILINGIRIRTTGIHPPQVEVTVETTGGGTGLVQICDGDNVVAEERIILEEMPKTGVCEGFAYGCRDTERMTGGCEAAKEVSGKGAVKITLPGARLWSADEPNLYQCRVVYGKDEQAEQFGIRLLAWDEENGLSVNGEHVILRGACIHHDNGVLGACAFPEAEERKIRILKENGYNAVRSAHNPCSKAMLDACDRLGVYLMDEYVDVWYIHKTEHDYADYMNDWWKTDLKEMVEKDYNHPSVVMYSTGNEVAETAQARGIALTKEMTEYLHGMDAGRPVSCGINIFFNFLSSIGFGVYSDEKAKKEPEAPGKKKPVGSEFYNTLAGMFGDYTMKLGATLYPCDVKTRDAYAGMDVAGYNYGIFRYRHDLKKYPKRLILGSETFCKDAYAFWETAKRNKRIVGDFVWAGMDYIGEAGIGAWEYEDYAPRNADRAGWLTAGSGRIDLLGFANGEALYTKVALEQTDDIYLCVKPVYQTGKHSPSAWKMTESQPSWSYHGCSGYRAEIEVYARAYEVALFLNGKHIGKKRPKKGVASFKTVYEDGELLAVAYNAAGVEIRRTALRTAGEKTCLSLMPETLETHVGGLVFVPMVYTDETGIWKPMEKHRLSVEVEGGSLAGLGNACPYNPDGYCRSGTKTYYGRALAVVRAESSGPVRIRVNDETQQYETVITCK